MKSSEMMRFGTPSSRPAEHLPNGIFPEAESRLLTTDLVGSERIGAVHPFEPIDDPAMGAHHAFRITRRARSVDDVGESLHPPGCGGASCRSRQIAASASSRMASAVSGTAPRSSRLVRMCRQPQSAIRRCSLADGWARSSGT